MSLATRKADLQTAITALQACVTSCNTDIAAQDPDAGEINQIRNRCQGALVQMGLAGWANEE